jgi:hypothetical protein
MRKFLPSIAFNAIVPFLAYVLLRPYVDGEVAALAIAAGVPAVFTIVVFLWRKRVDVIGATAIAAYVVVLLISVLAGGNPLILKLNDAVLTGPFGLICLASLVIGKPLHVVLHEYLARRKGTEISDRTRKGSTVITGIVGVMLTLHALVLLFLALSLSTESFLAVSRIVGLSIIAVGVAAIFWYRRRLVSLPAKRS